MKTLLCLVLLFVAIDCGPSKEEIDAKWEEVRQQQQAEWDREQKARLLE